MVFTPNPHKSITVEIAKGLQRLYESVGGFDEMAAVLHINPNSLRKIAAGEIHMINNLRTPMVIFHRFNLTVEKLVKMMNSDDLIKNIYDYQPEECKNNYFYVSDKNALTNEQALVLNKIYNRVGSLPDMAKYGFNPITLGNAQNTKTSMPINYKKALGYMHDANCEFNRVDIFNMVSTGIPILKAPKKTLRKPSTKWKLIKLISGDLRRIANTDPLPPFARHITQVGGKPAYVDGYLHDRHSDIKIVTEKDYGQAKAS